MSALSLVVVFCDIAENASDAQTGPVHDIEQQSVHER